MGSIFNLWDWSDWILWLLGAKPDAKQGRRKEACFLNIGGARSAVWWYKYIQIHRYDIEAVVLHWYEILVLCLLIHTMVKKFTYQAARFSLLFSFTAGILYRVVSCVVTFKLLLFLDYRLIVPNLQSNNLFVYCFAERTWVAYHLIRW